jgi:hypothetical protein
MMATELEPIDISDLPELLRIAEEVRLTRQPRMLRRDGEDIAVLMPPPRPRRRSSRGKPLTKDDPLFRLIGIGRSGIPGGVSEQKDQQLLRAKRAKT